MEQQLTIYNTLNRKKGVIRTFACSSCRYVCLRTDRLRFDAHLATHVLPLLSIYFSAILHTLAIKCAMSAILPM